MEFGGNEVEDIGMPMPLNYDSIRESSSKLQVLSSVSNGAAGASEEISAKKAFVYRECLKNHAASLGGHAVDGCAEFMPSGDEGTLEALKCAACFCHRNFHRREVEGEPCCLFCNRKRGAFVPLGSPPLALPLPGHMSFASSEEHLNAAAAAVAGSSAAAAAAAAKKRFRTKFTNEQKDKMLVFAEKLGWRIQKQDEAAVQHFCHDSGVKRHVLKVWMHNNKHTLGKKT